MTIEEGKNGKRNRSRKSSVVSMAFAALWRLLGLILELTGRVVCVVLGLALVIVSIVVSLTVVGAIVGVPLGNLGLLLIVRGFLEATKTRRLAMARTVS